MENYNDSVEISSDNELAKSIVDQVNRIFLANLASEYPHLFEAQVRYLKIKDKYIVTLL